MVAPYFSPIKYLTKNVQMLVTVDYNTPIVVNQISFLFFDFSLNQVMNHTISSSHHWNQRCKSFVNANSAVEFRKWNISYILSTRGHVDQLASSIWRWEAIRPRMTTCPTQYDLHRYFTGLSASWNFLYVNHTPLHMACIVPGMAFFYSNLQSWGLRIHWRICSGQQQYSYAMICN